jgi:hypothetical protein
MKRIIHFNEEIETVLSSMVENNYCYKTIIGIPEFKEVRVLKYTMGDFRWVSLKSISEQGSERMDSINAALKNPIYPDKYVFDSFEEFLDWMKTRPDLKW